MFPKNAVSVAIIAATFASVGCSSSDSSGTPSDTPPIESTMLSGTAAAGAPLIGQVTVKGALGNTNSAYIEADGSYDVDVNGLTAPYRLRAQGSVGGRTYKLHSYAEAADVGGTINITPFTDLIIANAAQQLASSFFESTTTTELSAEDVETQKVALQAKLQNVFDALGLGTAIDLLKDSFSADHSGLDAALDIINISVDESTNVATITNLVEGSSIVDNLLDADDNNDTVTVTNAATLTTAVSDTQAIANIFNSLNSAFANGLPAEADIDAYFATSFTVEDGNKASFLSEVTMDPDMVGVMFNNTSIKNLDSTNGTAEVTFNVGFNGLMDPRSDTWYAVKDETHGWQLDGDQRIVDAYFSFHCNDYDGTDSISGSCGINAAVVDNDFNNNGTANNDPIASATVSIIDGSNDASVKAVIYLGTPQGGDAGGLQVYDEGNEFYSGDWKAFGSINGQIDSSVFAVGDTIEYAVYTEVLDLTNPALPAIATNAVPVETYTETLLFEPATGGQYPTATAETITAINDFSLGDNLTVAWNRAEGTVNNEVLVIITDTSGNQLEVWAETWGAANNSVTFASTQLDTTAVTDAGLDTAAGYELRVRIYTMDPVTGQKHSRDYAVNPSGDTGGGGSSLVCDYESGWDDNSNQPATFNSYTDFETVVADCDALTINSAYIEGTTWSDIWTDDDGSWVDSFAFNADGTGTYTETLNGNSSSPEDFSWTVDNNRVTITIPGQFLEIWAFTSDSEQKAYSEATDWTSPSDLTPDGTADGEIWTGYFVKQ